MATFATFDPAAKDASITLSNGNLTATDGSNGWGGVRTTVSVTSGKWYWEITVVNQPDNTAVGCQTTAQTLSGFISDNQAWWYAASSQWKQNGATQVAYGTGISSATARTAGFVAGIALDMDAGSIEFFGNGVSQGVAYASGISGTQFGIWYSFGTNDSATANFGASAFTYSVPSGFNPGLYTGTIGGTSHNLTLIGAGS